MSGGIFVGGRWSGGDFRGTNVSGTIVLNLKALVKTFSPKEKRFNPLTVSIGSLEGTRGAYFVFANISTT